MARFLSSLMMVALVGLLTLPASASKAHMNQAGHGCAKGQVFVHGYTKNGKHVKGYCRAK